MFSARNGFVKIMDAKILFSGVLALSLAQNSWSATFVGTGGGDIPDSPHGGPAQYGTPLVICFNVSNLVSAVQSVSLSITLRHQWLGDLDVQLQSPTSTNFVIFSHCGGVGADQYGNPAYLGAVGMSDGTAWATNWGTYTFADSGQYSLRGYTDFTWGGFNNGLTYTIPSGTYRTSSIGTNDVPTTFTNSGFAGMLPAVATGTWTLTFRDGANLYTGSVQTATLTLGQLVKPLFTGITFSNGLVTLKLTGPDSQGFTIYSATNLAQPMSAWSTNGTGVFDGSGKATYTTNSTGALRFYWASSP